MITQPTPTPAHLVNRDLKLELRYLPPGESERVRNVRVERLTGKRKHLYKVYGGVYSLDDVANIISGRAALPSLFEGLPLFDYLKGVTA